MHPRMLEQQKGRVPQIRPQAKIHPTGLANEIEIPIKNEIESINKPQDWGWRHCPVRVAR